MITEDDQQPAEKPAPSAPEPDRTTSGSNIVEMPDPYQEASRRQAEQNRRPTAG
jgi:hypothetical protein